MVFHWTGPRKEEAFPLERPSLRDNLGGMFSSSCDASLMGFATIWWDEIIELALQTMKHIVVTTIIRVHSSEVSIRQWKL